MLNKDSFFSTAKDTERIERVFYPFYPLRVFCVFQGCAISQAYTSMMIDLVRGQTTEKAQMLIDTFLGMIAREITEEDQLEMLDEAVALQNISNIPARVKCAVIMAYIGKCEYNGKRKSLH